MPVERFRSFEEAREALDRSRRDESLEKRVRALFAVTDYLSPNVYARGVRRFRTIDDANADREGARRSQ